MDRDGKTVIDSISVSQVKNLPKDSCGVRYPDGSSFFVSSTMATPGEANVLAPDPEEEHRPVPGDIGTVAAHERLADGNS